MSEPGACDGCTRPIEPGRICPFCRTRQALPHPALRRLSLALATIGLLALFLYQRAREPPEVCIENLTPRMHHATVTITGTLTHVPFLSDTGGYASLRVAGTDGSTIRVQVYGDAVSALHETTASAPGTRIKVTGVLRIQAGSEPSIRLRRPEDMTVLKAPAESLRE